MSIINVFPGNPGLASSEKDGLMSSFDKAKLDTIEKNANNYIHPATHSADIIEETTNRKFVTKEEKDKINSMTDVATQDKNGLMSSTDKKKLDGIEDGANKYIHPVSHPATMITQNEQMRFVSDTEKSTWNNKADKTLASHEANGLFSSVDKIKLDGIQEGADKYEHPSTHPASMITESTDRRFVSDAEKATWNDKADKKTATPEEDGLFSSVDKKKLDTIAEGANNYVHPDSHPASMITQDVDHRFVSDGEKTTWNNKAEKTTATTASDGLMSAADKTKLEGIAPNANNYVHPSKHTPDIIEQDTSNRFVSDIQIASWDGKAEKTEASSDTAGLMSATDKAKLDTIEEGSNKYIHPAKHEASIITQDATHRFVSDAEKAKWDNKPDDKTDLGLGNVTNDAQVKRSEMGVASGVATLDETGKVPTSQLPSYVDDVVEYDNREAFPPTGESGKIYVDKAANNTYRWSGSSYVIIGGSLTLGETESTAYAGNKGKANADEIAKIKNGTTVVPKAGDAATVTGFTVGVNVPANAKFTDTVYTHPENHPATMITEDIDHRFVSDTEKATWNAKADNTLASIKANGLMSKEDKTKLDNIANGANNYVHPDNHPATMITQDSTHRFVSDSEKSTWNAKASTATASSSLNGLMSATDKKKLDTIEEGANKYTHPASHDASMIIEDGTHRFTTDTEKATWNAKADTTVASTSKNGLMSSADKTKLDGIASGANNYTHPENHPATMITQDSTHRFVTDTEKNSWSSKANADHTHTTVSVNDTRADNPAPNDPGFIKKVVSFDLKSNEEIDSPPVAGSYSAMMSIAPGVDQSVGNGYELLFGYSSNPSLPKLCIRTNTLNSSNWGAWQEVYTTANKPTPAALGAATASHTHQASTITEDVDHKFVTDTQIATWNAKAPSTPVTQSANGLMTAVDKKKLDGIASNANNYVHPDSHKATMITQDSTHRFVSDAQINEWNAKASTNVATVGSNGLMSATDKAKLDGIAKNANNYVHPSSHEASMITEDALHRFTTDDEKATWNAKADTTVASTSKNGLMSSTDKSNLNSALSRIATLESQQAEMLAKLKTAVFWGN